MAGVLIPPLDLQAIVDAATLQTDPHEFENMAQATAQSLDGESAAMDLQAADARQIQGSIDAKYLQAPIDEAQRAFDGDTTGPDSRDVDHALAGSGAIDKLLGSAGKGLPGPGAIPPKLRPPPVTGGVTIPPAPKGPPAGSGRVPGSGASPGGGTTFPPPVKQPGVPPSEGGPGGGASKFVLSVDLFNMSRPGAADFSVGDHFELDFQIMPGGAITVSGTQNNVPFAAASFGNADGDGIKVITGTMDAGSKGFWAEQWYANGKMIGDSPIEFVVK